MKRFIVLRRDSFQYKMMGSEVQCYLIAIGSKEIPSKKFTSPTLGKKYHLEKCLGGGICYLPGGYEL